MLCFSENIQNELRMMNLPFLTFLATGGWCLLSKQRIILGRFVSVSWPMVLSSPHSSVGNRAALGEPLFLEEGGARNKKKQMLYLLFFHIP